VRQWAGWPGARHHLVARSWNMSVLGSMRMPTNGALALDEQITWLMIVE
jgi:hypothetical protein